MEGLKLNNISIEEVRTHCNLGLSIANDLSWKDHVTNLINRANSRLNVLSKSRFTLPRLALSRLYISMVRPILEYGDVIYDNSPLSIGQSIEKSQRHAALICTGAYRHTETQSLLRDLGWSPLSDRRASHKLTLFYKIHHGIYPDYIQKLIPKPVQRHYTLRHESRIPPIKTRLVSMANSYIPSTITAWNKLPQRTVDSESATIFANIFKHKPPPSLNYYTNCTGRPGIWLTRLTLGLSALKDHRYRYNLIDDPYCEFCGHSETTKHYLFDCAALQNTILQ